MLSTFWHGVTTIADAFGVHIDTSEPCSPSPPTPTRLSWRAAVARPPRALPRVRAHPPSHPSDPFLRARFFALFETVRRSSDASARARRYIRAVPLADRALPLPDPISSQQRPRARPRRRARRRRPPARRWPPRSAAGHLPVARNDPRMPRGFAHPPQTRPSFSRATWPPRHPMPPHPPDSCGRARRSSPRSSPSPWLSLIHI